MSQLVSDVTSVLDYKDSKKEAETQRQQILSDIAASEKEKNNLVKKTLASQRAKYGASGMKGDSMTEGAVLTRLKEETAQPFEEKKKTNLEKLKSIKNPKFNLLTSLLSKFDNLLG